MITPERVLEAGGEEVREDNGFESLVKLTLRRLWLGYTLTVWWEEWPTWWADGKLHQGEYPQWVGLWELGQTDYDTFNLSPRLLQHLKTEGLVDRGKRPQKRDEQRQWTLSDKGLALLGLPSQAEMSTVQRVESATPNPSESEKPGGEEGE
jgi:hypothetical protein